MPGSHLSHKRASSTPLKLLALVVDVFILLGATGDNLRKCNEGLFSTSSLTHTSSTLVIVLCFATVYILGAVAIVLAKYCSYCCGDKPPTESDSEDISTCKMCGYICYDVVALIMGVSYLIGDNITDEVCMFYQCSPFHLNTDTCMISID
jgi:hypothetical protein